VAIVQPKSHLFLLLLCAAVVFPFLVVISVSLRPGNFASGSLIPPAISLEHWRFVLGLPYPGPDGQPILPDLPVMRWLWNSIKVALLSATVTLLLSTTASYALARIRFRGRQQLLTGLMLMQMFPAVLALVAIYAIFDRIGTAFPAIGLNTHGSLVLAYSGGIAMHVWTLKGYYDTLPGEIEEAARVDGAKPWQAFWRVLLPMAIPILVVVFMLAFIGAVIEYPVASVLLSQQDQLTLAVGSKLFVQEHNFRWGDFAAAALLSGLPITTVFLLAQRWMIAGLAAGGVKG
jgi:maltose/maltodextrin transport system permease protein